MHPRTRLARPGTRLAPRTRLAMAAAAAAAAAAAERNRDRDRRVIAGAFYGYRALFPADATTPI